jgi:hypothetical protein
MALGITAFLKGFFEQSATKAIPKVIPKICGCQRIFANVSEHAMSIKAKSALVFLNLGGL